MLLMICSILGEGRNLFRISWWRQCFHSPLDSDDAWGRTYKCDYFRGRHKGSIKVSERGRLMDLSQEVDPGEMPRTVARVAARESRHGLIRRVSLDEDDGRLVYKVEAYYGESRAKIKLKITRGGQVLGRDFD
jgi:hypothetical protein